MKIMKLNEKGWRLCPRWEWERTGQILLFRTSGVKEETANKAYDVIQDLLQYFCMPLKIAWINPVEQFEIEEIIDRLKVNKELEPQRLLTYICDLKENKQNFTPGIILLVSSENITFNTYYFNTLVRI